VGRQSTPTSHHGLDAGQQHFHRERHDEVIIGAAFESRNRVRVLRNSRADDDDGGIGRAPFAA